MKTSFTLKRDIVAEGDKADKLPPQAKAIVSVLKSKFGVGKTVDRADLVKELAASGALTTRQEPARILSFYQNALSDAGIVSITKVAAEKPAKEPKAKTPAKAPAAKSAA